MAGLRRPPPATTAGADALRSYRFRRDREATWRRLDELVHRAQRKGARALTPTELAELPALYRATMSGLSVARSISLDRNLREYLENLCQRAFLVVYGVRRPFGRLLVDLFTKSFPAGVRRLRWHLLLATSFLLLGTALGFVLTTQDADRFFTFVPESMASGRGPQRSTEALEAMLYDTPAGDGDLAAFASQLFTNNARVGVLVYAVGFLAGVPVFILLVMNGLILGAFVALYVSRGLGMAMGGWLLPHGVTELLAIVICGATGLSLGQALVFPGPRRRLENLARAGRETSAVMIGAIGMLLIAGVIEGVFRQRVTDDALRWLLASTTAVIWLLYFGLVGRERRAGA